MNPEQTEAPSLFGFGAPRVSDPIDHDSTPHLSDQLLTFRRVQIELQTAREATRRRAMQRDETGEING